MGVGLSAEQIRDAQIYNDGFAAGKRAGFRAAARARRAVTAPGEHAARGREIVARIALACAERFGVALAEFEGRARAHELARARDLACFLMMRLSGLGSIAVGRAFGGRDHTTVLYGVERFARAAAAEPRWMDDARAIAAALGREPPLQKDIEP